MENHITIQLLEIKTKWSVLCL